MNKKKQKQPKTAAHRMLAVNNEEYFSLKLLSLFDEKKQKGRKKYESIDEKKLMFRKVKR
jgi:hypothetical protein